MADLAAIDASWRSIRAIAPPRPTAPRPAARVVKPVHRAPIRVALSPIRVLCPTCRQRPGEGCEVLGLGLPIVDFHRRRIDAARVVDAREQRKRVAKNVVRRARRRAVA